MNVVEVVLLAVQFYIVSGRLTVLRGKSTKYTTKLICVSDDDGAALIWNFNLTSSTVFKDAFRNSNEPPSKNVLDCKLNETIGCTTSWITTGWSLTLSNETLMGPVFDSRWEGFQENTISPYAYHKIRTINSKEAFPVSIRGSHDVYMLICAGEHYNISSCYWIIIGGWGNTESAIRKCENGVPFLNKFATDKNCEKKRANYKHAPLSSVEWTTFIVTWDKSTKNITVYDNKTMIMTFEDDEDRSQEKNFTLFLGSKSKTLFRFHSYNFLHTTVENAGLVSPELPVTSSKFCVEMAVGLCANCRLELSLVNTSTGSILEELGSFTGAASIYGLPTWQYVRVDKPFSFAYSKVKLKMVPGLIRTSQEPLWAVANVRSCPPAGSVRMASITVNSQSDQYICQRHFYNNNNTVMSISGPVNAELDFEDLNCPRDKVGPYCSISCSNELNLDENCEGGIVCVEEGCACSYGIVGRHCEKTCKGHEYGHNCKHKCGSCEGSCSPRNGECAKGCKNSSEYKIPPLCQIGIDPLPPPTISFLNSTAIGVSIPLKKEYRLALPNYGFELVEVRNDQPVDVNAYVSNNGTSLIGIGDDLKAGFSYQIRSTLTPSNYPTISSEWKDFTTPCDPINGFDVEAKNTSLILKWKEQKPISCPSSWYYFTLKENTTNREIYSGSPDSQPHEFRSLRPYTSYQITIVRNEGKNVIEYFSSNIDTLEAAPSEVRNIVCQPFSNSVNITWDPPETLNGALKKYIVDVETIVYIGCHIMGVTPPTKKRIQFDTTNNSAEINVAPYARHVARITACTSFCGPEAKSEFETNENEIPTEKFDDVSMKGFVLEFNWPKDCTTITGNVEARVTVNGVSEAVANLNITKYVNNTHTLDLTAELYGAEKYEARIYVVRKEGSPYNENVYQELNFITPAKAPPPVSNLEAYEINEIVQSYTEFKLRWQEPTPPLNGKLQHYVVKFNNKHTEVKPTAHCALWPYYICAMVNVSETQDMITVSAVNEGVSEESEAMTVMVDHSITVPTEPEIYRLEALSHGIVLATWSHPWMTNRRLQQFILSVQRTSTRLRTNTETASFKINHPVEEYESQYNHRLNLMPSSVYDITIFAKTVEGTESLGKLERVETLPAFGFEKEPFVEARNENSTVPLRIPAVLNDTTESTINVIVQGSRVCNDDAEAARILCEKIGMDCYQTAWWAASFPSDRFAGEEPFMIGGTEYHDDAINCSLRQRESYVISVSLYEYNDTIMFAKPLVVHIGEVSKGFIVTWLILILILVGLIFAIVIFYFYRRKLRTKSSTEMVKQESHESDKILTTAGFTATEPSPTGPITMYVDSVAYKVSAYSNQKENNSSSLVKVKDFEDYVKQAIESGLLDNQYNSLPSGQTKPWDYGKLPQNKLKNRYGNLIAYDENRVVLEKLPNDPYSDYINANYINGYKKDNCYIATQGPKSITVNDFWRMIWQEESLIICMLTNVIESEKTKCEQYWPDIGKKMKYGELVVFNAKHTVYADYTFRTLHLTRGEQTRERISELGNQFMKTCFKLCSIDYKYVRPVAIVVNGLKYSIKHLHYTAWPDHGVPSSTHSIVAYMKKLLATSPGNGPTVIHCSAGVGRTGTIIICDICLRKAAAEGVIDVFAETVALRSQRVNMVDTMQQYLLVHLTLLECLFSISTTLPCDKTLPMKIEEQRKGLAIQQKNLEKAIWRDEVLRPSANKITLSERNLAKNRFPELASEKMGRVYLKRYPLKDEDSDYISAVYVDGIIMRNQYIATQLPLPETFGDFWRMVAEYNIELIVSLQPPDPEDPTCCPLVPSPDFNPVPYINIKTEKTVAYNHHSLQQLTLVDNTSEPVTEQRVSLVSSTEWKAGRYQDPPSTIALMTMWQATETIYRGNRPTAILCHDATTGCGLYLALSVLLERMAVERECDVCLAIRSVRRSNHGFVQSLEQMEYLYQVANTFLKYFETYANFT